LTNKTMEMWQKEISDLAKESATIAVQKIAECREEILIAFLAKYNMQPNEAVIVQQGLKTWVEKTQSSAQEDLSKYHLHKELARAQTAFDELHHKYESLVDYLKIVLCDMPAEQKFDGIFIDIERKLISLGEIEEQHE
jgi:hypothetical protein